MKHALVDKSSATGRSGPSRFDELDAVEAVFLVDRLPYAVGAGPGISRESLRVLEQIDIDTFVARLVVQVTELVGRARTAGIGAHHDNVIGRGRGDRTETFHTKLFGNIRLVLGLDAASAIHAETILVPKGALFEEVDLVVFEKVGLAKRVETIKELRVDGFDHLVVTRSVLDLASWAANGFVGQRRGGCWFLSLRFGENLLEEVGTSRVIGCW